MKKRDRQLGDALCKLDVPEHSPDFFERLESDLDLADADRAPLGARPKAHPRWWSGWASGGSTPRGRSGGGSVITARPLSGGLVALALATAIFAAVMVAPPLLRDEVGPISPGIASAAEVKAKVAAALQKASALRGVLVVVSGEASASGDGEMRWSFATSDRGDFRLSGENELLGGTVLREELAYDAVAGVETSWSQEGDDPPFVGSRSGLAAGPPDPSPSRWVLQRDLGAVVRALLAAEDPSVTEVTYEGRPAWVLETDVPANLLADLSPDRLRVTVDQDTGFPVRVVETREGSLLQELRLEQLEVDPVLEEDFFKLTLPQELEAPPTEQGFRRVELSGVEEVVGYAPTLPAWLPEGYELTLVTVAEQGQSTGKEGMNPAAGGVVSLGYRRGFDQITISTRLVGEEPSLWSDPLSAGEGFIDRPETLVLQAGDFAGREAEIMIDPLTVPHLWTIDSTLVLVVAGDAGREELIRVAESLGRGRE